MSLIAHEQYPELDNPSLFQFKVNLVNKHKIIYHSEQHLEHFYFINTGVVGLYRQLQNGKESLLRIYGPRHYFGYRSLLGDDATYLMSKALTDSELIEIKPNKLSSFIIEHPSLATYFIKELSKSLKDAEIRLSRMGTHKSYLRAIDSILSLFEVCPDYPWTYREIAEYSGTNVETLIRLCTQLKKESLLDPNNRKIKIINKLGLIELREKMARGE